MTKEEQIELELEANNMLRDIELTKLKKNVFVSEIRIIY